MISSLPERFARRLAAECDKEPGVKKVILFGSRARGNYRLNSDIDLALAGEGIPPRLSARLREAAGLYSLDIVHLSDLDNPDLREEIDNEGITIYEK